MNLIKPDIKLLKNESFKHIKGFENIYGITTHGRVYSFPYKNNGTRGKCSHNGMWLKPYIVKGYHVVDLRKKDQNRSTKKVHRLVAEAFIENVSNKPMINHKDGIKTNNIISNLEWVTSIENNLHSYKLGLNNGNKGIKMNISSKGMQVFRDNQRRMSLSNIKISIYDASEICEAYDTGLFTHKEIALYFNVSRKTIGNLINGVTKYGF